MRSSLKLPVLISLMSLAAFACGRSDDLNLAQISEPGSKEFAYTPKKAEFKSRIHSLKDAPTISTWSAATFAPANLYVVLSGNGSCPKGYPSGVAPGLQENELFMAFNQWILSGGLVTAADRVIYACYEWQSPRMKFYDLRAERQMLPLVETQIPELVAGRMQGFSKIFIVGHSHAGWLAMKLASSPWLVNSTNAPIILASIDPVSRVTCQRLREPGCREAPRDFTASELQTLNVRTRWINLYHQPAIILGSGPMAAAHQSVHINANHVAMQTDPDVWQNVRQFFLNFR